MSKRAHGANRLAAAAATALLLSVAGPAASLDPPRPIVSPAAPSLASASASAPSEALNRRATRADAEAARQAVMAMLRALEAGDLAAMESRLDPALPGRQRLLEELQRQAGALQRLQISTFDVQVTAGPQLAVVQLAWEKRAFTATGLVPLLTSGRSSLMLHRSGGVGERWRLTAVEGDSLLAPGTGAGAPGATLTLAARSLSWSQLGTGCPGTEPLPSSATAVTGTVTGTALFPPGATSTTVLLAGHLSGARIGTAPVSLAGFPVQLDIGPNRPPAALLSVPLRLDLAGQATGPVTGPFEIRATSADLNVATSYPDSLPASLTVSGELSGTATSQGHSFNVDATLSGELTNPALEPVRINRLTVVLQAASGLSSGMTASASASLTATVLLQPDGRYAGTASGIAGGGFSRPEQRPLGFSGPVSIDLAGIRALPRAPLTANVRGAAAVVQTRVGSPPAPCLPVALALELADPASQGRGFVIVQAQSGSGDSELLRLTETSPGRFARVNVPMARAGAVRRDNGVIELPEAGTSVSFVYVDTVSAPGTARPRRVVAVLRVD